MLSVVSQCCQQSVSADSSRSVLSVVSHGCQQSISADSSRSVLSVVSQCCQQLSAFLGKEVIGAVFPGSGAEEESVTRRGAREARVGGLYKGLADTTVNSQQAAF